VADLSNSVFLLTCSGRSDSTATSLVNHGWLSASDAVMLCHPARIALAMLSRCR
jgi:hypothetical protein